MRNQGETEVDAPAIVLPARSRRYGVGKEIGGAVYLHRDYERLLGNPVQAAKEWLPIGFTYTVVKYQPKTGIVSFIHSPDFDESPEPIVSDVWTIHPDGHATLTRRLADPYIYHHKWLFVAPDYKGFNVTQSMIRSRSWLSLAGVDSRRIGRKKYWQSVLAIELGERSDE